jgi:hypothetical protein
MYSRFSGFMGKLSGMVVLAIQTLATAGIFRVTFSIVLRKNGGKPARRDTVAIEKLSDILPMLMSRFSSRQPEPAFQPTG